MLTWLLLVAFCAAVNLYCALRNLHAARFNMEVAERNSRLAHRLDSGEAPDEMHVAQAVHPLLSKWWMRSRPCVGEITADGIGGALELHCPWWARPLEALHVLLFGSTKLLPIPPAEPKAEPIAMEITVDTTDLKAALALLEQIAAEAKRANDALDVMRANGVSVVTR